jgi:hypothetical protein
MVAATVLRGRRTVLETGCSSARSEDGSRSEADLACGFTTCFLFESLKIQKWLQVWFVRGDFVKDGGQIFLIKIAQFSRVWHGVCVRHPASQKNASDSAGLASGSIDRRGSEKRLQYSTTSRVLVLGMNRESRKGPTKATPKFIVTVAGALAAEAAAVPSQILSAKHQIT